MQTRGSRTEGVGSEAAAKTDEARAETWEVAGRYFTEVLFSEYFEQTKNRSGGQDLHAWDALLNLQNAFVT